MLGNGLAARITILLEEDKQSGSFCFFFEPIMVILGDVEPVMQWWCPSKIVSTEEVANVWLCETLAEFKHCLLKWLIHCKNEKATERPKIQVDCVTVWSNNVPFSVCRLLASRLLLFPVAEETFKMVASRQRVNRGDSHLKYCLCPIGRFILYPQSTSGESWSMEYSHPLYGLLYSIPLFIIPSCYIPS